MATAPELAQRLRAAGLHVTRPRQAVLAAVARNPHADTGSILDAARHELPRISHQTVYDCLNVLTDAGLLRRIQPAGSVARYETRTGDNHHHLICQGCGTIVDVDCAVGYTPCLTAADDHGYRIQEAEVIYWGYCTGCQADQPLAGD